MIPAEVRHIRLDHQGIDIEIMLAVLGDAAEHVVVQRPLHHIGIFASGFQRQHPQRPHGQADGRAGFGIAGVVGQVVVDGEALAVALGAHAAGDVHALAGHVFPQGVQGVQQRLVAGFPGHVRHAGIQVHGANRMALRRGLLQHRQVHLVVIRINGLVLLQQFLVARIVKEARLGAAVEDEVLRQLPVLVLPGQAVCLHQGQLNFLMPWIGVDLPLALAEGVADQVHQPVHDFQKAFVSCHLGIGHRSLQHVPSAV